MSRGSDLPDVSIADDRKGFVRRAELDAEEVRNLRPHLLEVEGEPWNDDGAETTCPVCGASVAAQPRSLADHWLENPDWEPAGPLDSGEDTGTTVTGAGLFPVGGLKTLVTRVASLLGAAGRGTLRALVPSPSMVLVALGWALQLMILVGPLAGKGSIPDLVGVYLGWLGWFLFPLGVYLNLSHIESLQRTQIRHRYDYRDDAGVSGVGFFTGISAIPFLGPVFMFVPFGGLFMIKLGELL